jgi:hypothetical protein
MAAFTSTSSVPAASAVPAKKKPDSRQAKNFERITISFKGKKST